MLTILKRSCIYTFAALVLFSTQNLNAYPMIDGTIERVIDGDTVVFNSMKFNNLLEDSFGTDVFDGDVAGVHVRMVGMDTPETHFRDASGNWVSQGAHGDSATAALKRLVGKTKVTLENQGFD